MDRSLYMIAPLLFAVAFSGCAEKKNLEEMHDSTLEMKDTTKELLTATRDMRTTTDGMSDRTRDMHAATQSMDQKTEKIEKGTEKIVALTGELYDASRQGAALQLRREAIESLNKAQSSGKKLEEAAAYFMSFEYQLWTGFGPDETQEKRALLVFDAAKEFFKNIKEFLVDDSGSFNPFAQVEAHGHVNDGTNKEASFNALSAAMHSINRKQEESIAAKPGLKLISVYSLIADSLRAEKQIDAGKTTLESLSEAEKVVLESKQTAVRLLQARHNFIVTIFLSDAIPKGGRVGEMFGSLFRGQFAEAKNRLSDRIRAGLNYYLNTGARWDFDVDRFNEAQLIKFKSYIDASLKTRKLLREVGIEPQVDKTVLSFLKGLRFRSAGQGGPQMVVHRTELMALLTELAADSGIKAVDVLRANRP